MPYAKQESEKENQQAVLDQHMLSEAVEIDREIQSEQGSAILEEIKRRLEIRLEVFAAQDPECRVLIQVLDTFGIKIAKGKDAAERIAKRSLRK